MKTRYHLSVNIEGLLNQYKRKKMNRVLVDDNGKSLNDSEARAYLIQAIQEGKRVLPTADCEGFDFVKGCPGHPIENEQS